MAPTKIPLQNRKLFDFLACLLIILSHFATYILYAGYTRLLPDMIVIIGALCAVAVCLTVLLQIPSRIFRAMIFAVLTTIVISDAIYEFGVADISTRLIALTITLLGTLTLIFFLREHASKVLIGAFLAMLLSTIVIAAFDTAGQASQTARIAQENDDTQPIIVHLILDEHMGAAGMTAALPSGEQIGHDLRQFYERHGFRLFSHAYSQYFDTAPSLASMLNFSDRPFAESHLIRRRYGFSLAENAYLKNISDLNYRIRIYQSNYIDFCQTAAIRIAKCHTYKPDNLKSFEITGLPLVERAALVLRMYYSSFTLVKLLKLVEQPVVSWARRWGFDMEGFGLWHGRVGPLAAAPSFEQLLTDLSHAKGGMMFFAHLLMPHYPYAYTSRCKVRTPISSWSLRWLGDGTNTPASRQKHYAEYFDQIRCMMRKLERLFDVMKRAGSYKNATIVIHGDHGSRINRSTPYSADRTSLSRTDFVDGFSTLFTVKAPGINSGTDARMLSLSRLLRYVTTREDRLLSDTRPPTIYLFDGDRNYLATPLPDFPGPSR